MIRNLFSTALILGLLSACSPSTEGTADGSSDASKLDSSAQEGSRLESDTPETAAQGTTASPGTPIDPKQVPKIVASVDGRPIYRSELFAIAAQAQRQGAAQGGLTAEFFREMVEGLISQSLIAEAAKSEGITATEFEVNQRIASFKGRYPDPAQFTAALAEQGITEKELTDQTRTALTASKFIEGTLAPSVTIPAEAVKAFYDGHLEQMRGPEQRRMRHILVAADAQADAETKKKARAKADDLLAQIKKGGDFAALAKANSDDPGSKASGGDLGLMPPGRLVPSFEQASWALKPNEVSAVVETPFGYHIIQLLEIAPATTVPYEQAKTRIEQMLKGQKIQKLVAERVEKLRAKAKVEIFL